VRATQAFNVIAPGLELKDDVAASGVYELNEKFIKGFGVGMQFSQFKNLFKYDVKVYDNNGNEVTDTGCIGTGYTVSCEGDSCFAILAADINGDATVSSVDYISLQSSLKDKQELSEAFSLAADLNGDGVATTADCISMKSLLSGE